MRYLSVKSTYKGKGLEVVKQSCGCSPSFGLVTKLSVGHLPLKALSNNCLQI